MHIDIIITDTFFLSTYITVPQQKRFYLCAYLSDTQMKSIYQQYMCRHIVTAEWRFIIWKQKRYQKD